MKPDIRPLMQIRFPIWSVAIGGFTGRLFYLKSECEVNDPAPPYYIVPNQTFIPLREIGGRNKLLAPEHNYGHQSSHPAYRLSVSSHCDAYRALALYMILPYRAPKIQTAKAANAKCAIRGVSIGA